VGSTVVVGDAMEHVAPVYLVDKQSQTIEVPLTRQIPPFRQGFGVQEADGTAGYWWVGLLFVKSGGNLRERLQDCAQVAPV